MWVYALETHLVFKHNLCFIKYIVIVVSTYVLNNIWISIYHLKNDFGTILNIIVLDYDIWGLYEMG